MAVLRFIFAVPLISLMRTSLKLQSGAEKSQHVIPWRTDGKTINRMNQLITYALAALFSSHFERELFSPVCLVYQKTSWQDTLLR